MPTNFILNPNVLCYITLQIIIIHYKYYINDFDNININNPKSGYADWFKTSALKISATHL